MIWKVKKKKRKLKKLKIVWKLEKVKKVPEIIWDSWEEPEKSRRIMKNEIKNKLYLIGEVLSIKVKIPNLYIFYYSFLEPAHNLAFPCN